MTKLTCARTKYKDSVFLFNYTVYIDVSAADLDHTFICNYISRRHSTSKGRKKTVSQIILLADIEKCKNKAHTFLVNEDFKVLSTQCLTFTTQRGLETKDHPDLTVKYIQIERTKLKNMSLHFGEGESALTAFYFFRMIILWFCAGEYLKMIWCHLCEIKKKKNHQIMDLQYDIIW